MEITLYGFFIKDLTLWEMWKERPHSETNKKNHWKIVKKKIYHNRCDDW